MRGGNSQQTCALSSTSTLVPIGPNRTPLLWVHPSPRTDIDVATGVPVVLRCHRDISVAHSDCCACRYADFATNDPYRCLLTPNPRETTANPLFLLALGRAPPAASNCVCGDRWDWRTGRRVSTGWSDCLVGWLVLPASQVVVPKPPIYFVWIV